MLLSISLILIVGMFMGWLCQKCRLPSLLGMLATGMVLGPYVLNLLDGSILGISPELRKIALIIILTRAGLGLDTSGLKKLGRPAVLMCFVPASFELLGVLLLAPKLMGLTFLEAAILGAVLAAVSPAVVVPRMVRLMDEGYGGKQGIPQLILAGASVDDVYVIVLFSTFVGMMQGESASLLSFVNIPVSILLGMAVGMAVGSLLAYFFAKVHIRDTAKVLIILSISFLLVAAEDALTTAITFSALIAIMFIGIGLQKKRAVVAKRLSVKYGKLWVAAEVFLFVLVGATVNIGYLGKVGAKALLLIVGALVFRMLGVFAMLAGSTPSAWAASATVAEDSFSTMTWSPRPFSSRSAFAFSNDIFLLPHSYSVIAQTRIFHGPDVGDSISPFSYRVNRFIFSKTNLLYRQPAILRFTLFSEVFYSSDPWQRHQGEPSARWPAPPR